MNYNLLRSKNHLKVSIYINQDIFTMDYYKLIIIVTSCVTNAKVNSAWPINNKDFNDYFYREPRFSKILLHKQALNEDGTFNFAFVNNNGIQQGETIHPDGNRKGAYSYLDPHGKSIFVKYSAGKDGFQVLHDENNKYKSQNEYLRDPFSREVASPTNDQYVHQLVYGSTRNNPFNYNDYNNDKSYKLNSNLDTTIFRKNRFNTISNKPKTVELERKYDLQNDRRKFNPFSNSYSFEFGL